MHVTNPAEAMLQTTQLNTGLLICCHTCVACAENENNFAPLLLKVT